MHNIIKLDFETYSPVDLETGGAKQYIEHPEADVVCLGYKADHERTGLWVPESAFPFNITPSTIFYAHNAGFDYRIWNTILTKKYGVPPTELYQWRDTMAMCARYSLPMGLEKVGAVLNLDVQKQVRGKALIKKICCPTHEGKRPRLGYDYTTQDLHDFYDYCIDDVNTLHELVQQLPSDKLSQSEQELWELTFNMNDRGLPIDKESVDAIKRYVEIYIEEHTVILPEITNGAVTAPTQIKRIKDYCESQGYPIPNVQAPTIDAILDRDDVPNDVKTVLTLRQELGKSSTAKYRKIHGLHHNGHVYDNLCYYGAGPGRWAGRGFQMHNLPRAAVEDPEFWIEEFKNIGEIPEPVHTAKALIRPMICAKDGEVLIVSDYSSIENRNLHWLAFDDVSLELFRKDGCQYSDMAAFLYNEKYEDIVEGNNAGDKHFSGLRQMGKVIILGCGYQMGAPRFQATAHDWGMKITSGEAKVAVDAYRMKFRLVVKMWYNYSNSVKNAIDFPGKSFVANRCRFIVVKDHNGRKWLQITLPSMRAIYYYEPAMVDGRFGLTPAAWGIHPQTKQWTLKELSPGRITENIDQGLARDIMGQGLVNIDNDMPYVDLVGTVHDEAIGIVSEDRVTDETLPTFNRLMCGMPEWAEGLPLKAEGFIAKRYRK